jgi:hypothetical protein
VWTDPLRTPGGTDRVSLWRSLDTAAGAAGRREPCASCGQTSHLVTVGALFQSPPPDLAHARPPGDAQLHWPSSAISTFAAYGAVRSHWGRHGVWAGALPLPYVARIATGEGSSGERTAQNPFTTSVISDNNCRRSRVAVLCHAGTPGSSV